MRVSVIIPTWQARALLPALLGRLKTQRLPHEVIVVDSSSPDGTAEAARRGGCEVVVIPKASFRHGSSRNLGASKARGRVLAFLTQDALPADDLFLDRLVRPILAGKAAAAYARQIPYPEASPLEAFARRYNYPERPELRSSKDIPRLGIRAFFFSNTASAIDAETFHRLGGFSEEVIVNEDMHFCAGLLEAGLKVAYVPQAAVFHSHRYTPAQIFKRYFDIGVFMAQVGDGPMAAAASKTGGEGMRFLLRQLAYLKGAGLWHRWPQCLMEAGLKYAAWHLGRRHRLLPQALCRRCSQLPSWWDREG